MHTEEERNLIDAFMGSKGEYVSHKDRWGGEVWGEYKPTNYLNWEDLMDVVEVIESIKNNNYTVDITNNCVDIFSLNSDHNIVRIRGSWKKYREENEGKDLTKRQAVYKAVVEFIKWYNEQNK